MREPVRSYIVAATPRTGSSLLCEGLCATGLAGRPAEPFATIVEKLWRDLLNLPSEGSFEEFFDAAVRYGTRGGVYGLKIQWMHVELLGRRLGLDPGADVLATLFPEAQFINIVRNDRSAQAISLLRADRTNEWWSFSADSTRSDPGPFDPAELNERLSDIAAQQAAWDAYFAARSITPLVVEYERLSAHYGDEVRRVLRFLNIECSDRLQLPPPRHRRQADQINKAWLIEAQRTRTGMSAS